MRIFIGIIVVALGFLLVWKSSALLRFFGEIPFAEEKLYSAGGTSTFYKLIGVGIILLGFLIIGGDAETGVENFFENTQPDGGL